MSTTIETSVAPESIDHLDTPNLEPHVETLLSVWAPHADDVSVVLFEDSSTEPTPLTRSDDGCWRGSFSAPAGTEYRLRVRNGDEVFDRIDPRARKLTSSVGNAVVMTPFSAEDLPHFDALPLSDWVIYELHTGSFAGDLDGVVAKLDYLAHLGVNAIELMPVAEFAGDLSWGYNTAFPFAVEASYGGPEALRRLVAAAHERSIAVLVDVVYNHLGPSDLDLWRFDGWSENDGGGIYFCNDWRGETPWGATRPDYGRAEVRTFLIDSALMWIHEYGIDGLRLDSTVNIRNAKGIGGPDGALDDGWSFLAELVSAVKTVAPSAVMIAEDLQQELLIVETTDAGGLGFDAQWSAGFVHPVRAALQAIDDSARDLDAVVRAIRGDAEGNQRVIYTESHDEVANGRTRVPAEIDPDNPSSVWAFRRSALGAVVTLTSPGVAMMFQGQEWGDEDWFDDNRALEWGRGEQRAGHLALWRDLIGLRTGTDVRAGGLRGDQVRVERCGAGGEVLVVHRWGLGGPERSTVVVQNWSSQDTDVLVPTPAEGRWICVLSTDWSGYHPDGQDKLAHEVEASDGGFELHGLPAYAAAVFVRADE